MERYVFCIPWASMDRDGRWADTQGALFQLSWRRCAFVDTISITAESGQSIPHFFCVFLSNSDRILLLGREVLLDVVCNRLSQFLFSLFDLV